MDGVGDVACEAWAQGLGVTNTYLEELISTEPPFVIVEWYKMQEYLKITVS